ncbi:MAG: DNA-binding protein [Burkholderiaceae bacterium]|nr:DNA-binding protein [Burkholderiaceae bacterium]
MMSRQVHESDGQRVFVAVLETGDEAMSSLKTLARQEKLSAAGITAIGAFSDAVLRYFDWDRKDYVDIPVNEQVEVASLVGDIGVDAHGEPALHVHLVLGRRDGSALAGHLAKGHVRPTLEVVVTESPAHLRRREDPATGLRLIRF